MYEFFDKLLPEKMLENYKAILNYCDVKTSHGKLIGFIFSFGLLLSLFIATVSFFIFSLSTILFAIIWAGSYFVIEIFIYMRFWMIAEKRGNFVETILPDALQLMSMNLKAGLTTDKALITAARPEFGPFEKELRRGGKDIMTGKTTKEVLHGIRKRIKSDLLDRTFMLIAEGMDAGGELSDLLEQTAEDIENTKAVQREVRANVMMYVIFIFFAASIGAPIIFGISTYLLEVMQTQFGRYNVPESVSGEIGIKLGEFGVQISPDFLMLYTLLSLAITSIFGGMIIGLIKDGEEKSGIKYIPMLFGLSLIIFFAMRMFVSGMFTGLL